MSVKRIVFAVLCSLLVIVLIMTGVTVSRVIRLASAPDIPNPETTAPATQPSTQPSSEATQPESSAPVTQPSTQPSGTTGSDHVHGFTVASYLAPTCTDSGYQELVCSCGEIDWVVIDKLEHAYGYGETIAATCTTDGCTRFTCANCGNVEERNVIPATGHAYGNGITHEATCEENAYIEFTCTNPDCPDPTKLVNQTGTALGHDFVAGTPVEATCTTDGYTPYICSHCAVEERRDEVKGKHSFSAWEGTDVLERTCSTCQLVQSSDDLEITDSNFHDSDEYRVYEIFVGTEDMAQIYRYTITDYLNNGTLTYIYDPAAGLVITYTDAEQQEQTVTLTRCQDGQTTLPIADPDDSDENE